nr:ImmA/IrrE family metallo-endopeptidase [Bifidobacterium catenulatum]
MSAPSVTESIIIDDDTSPAKASHQLLYRTIADSDGQISLPVDLKAIAEAIGLQSEMRYLPNDVDGLLVRTETGAPFKAVMNASTSDNRRRFTLAHEIGHYIHQFQNSKKDGPLGDVVSVEDTAYSGGSQVYAHRDHRSSTGHDSNERWANSFAASLLMPASIVRVMWASGMKPDDMALRFGVSLQALTYRLKNLGLLQ